MPTLINRHLKIPKYLQLAEYLRGEIDSGRFLPDDRLPSLNDLKEQFGANQHTVERAHTLLENDGLIRREPGRGVFVNHPAPCQVTGNAGFVVFQDIQHEQNAFYWGLVLAGIRKAVQEHGYHLLLIDDGNTFEQWTKVDGAVFSGPLDLRDVPPGFPGVAIFNEMPGITCIKPDYFDGTYQLTRHLIQLGHRHIAYLAMVNAGLSQLEQRKEGYLKALREAHIKPDPRCVRELRKRAEWADAPNWYPQAGEYYTRKWLEEDWAELGCTALIAQNDATAYGAINVFQAAGLRVPRDVSVVGFDGLFAEAGAPLLTTIEAPLQEVGRQAMELLLNWLKDPAQTPQSVCLPIRFKEGQTTAPPLAAVSQQALCTASP